MSDEKVIISKSKLDHHNDVISAKIGTSVDRTVAEMDAAVAAIPTGTPLPPLTNPASASDVLDGKEVILPDANDQPIKVTGTLVPAVLSSDFVEVRKTTVVIGANSVSNMLELKTLLAQLADVETATVFAFAIHPKSTYNNNDISIVYFTSDAPAGGYCLYAYRYRGGWTQLSFSYIYDAIAEIGDIYDVYSVHSKFEV